MFTPPKKWRKLCSPPTLAKSLQQKDKFKKRQRKQKKSVYFLPPQLPTATVPSVALPTGGTSVIIQRGGQRLTVSSCGTCCVDTTLMTWTMLAGQSAAIRESLNHAAQDNTNSGHFANCVGRLLVAETSSDAMRARAQFFWTPKSSGQAR